MAPSKPLTPSEQMVGRRLPSPPKHLDTVLSRFVGSEGTFPALLPPSEEWLRPAFLTARRRGYLRQTSLAISIMGSRPESYWQLTPKGENEALAAAERVRAIELARSQWSADWTAAQIAKAGPLDSKEVEMEVSEERVPVAPR